VNLRILRVPRMDRLSEYARQRFVDFKSLIDGGIIVQQSPLNRIQSAEDFNLAASQFEGRTYAVERRPTEDESADMLFGWQVEQGVTSNSVIYVKNGVTVGIGTGEQDRVGVAEIAIYKAYTKYADAVCFKRHGVSYKELELMAEIGEKDRALIEEIDQETKEAKGGLVGASMVSDAFFPFRDGVDVAIRQGIRAIVQPGGSLRDYEVIEACNEADPQVTMVFTGQRAFKH
jgi:phosphoribosylaminoimidazolecarboxamide formyltransferase/IMP cyclohydrolase